MLDVQRMTVAQETLAVYRWPDFNLRVTQCFCNSVFKTSKTKRKHKDHKGTRELVG